MHRARVVSALLIVVVALFAAGCAAAPGAGGAALSVGLSLALVFGAAACAREPKGADGRWEECCVDGTLTTCFCPGEAVCNFGYGLVDCGDGTCIDQFVEPPQSCDDEPDGGTLEPCCLDGVMTTCECPAGLVCNFGLGWDDCGDGTCAEWIADPPQYCPDAGTP